jgi:hypothetical protein
VTDVTLVFLSSGYSQLLKFERTGISKLVREMRQEGMMNQPSTSFVERLADAKPMIGTLVSTSSTEVAEALSLCGFEWLFIDVEHSVQDMAAAQHIIQSVAPRTYAVIRLPDNRAEHFKKALDTGCDGVIVPMIKSVSDAERAVSLGLTQKQFHRLGEIV